MDKHTASFRENIPVALMGMLSLLGLLFFHHKICLESSLRWGYYYNLGSCFPEIALLFVALFCSLFFPKKVSYKAVCVFFVIAVFTYLHAFFFAFIGSCIYAVMILLTGTIICRLIAPEWQHNFMSQVLLGISGVLLLVCFFSALNLGTPEKLRINFSLILLAELLLQRRSIVEKVRQFLTCKSQPYCLQDAVYWGMIAIATTAFLIQVGRANIALDYDSLWYGLRSDKVLAPTGGIFDPVIMPGIVYFYPKGIESLSLVFNFHNTYSFVYAVNLMLASFFLLSVYQISAEYGTKQHAAFITMCCAVTAGIMNMASTAKSDIGALFFQILSFYFCLVSIKNKEGSSFFFAISAAVLSLSFKNSALIFSAIIVCVFLTFSLGYRPKLHIKQTIPLLLGLLTTGLFWLRSYLLTGIPVNFFHKLWNILGFTFKFPYSSGPSGISAINEIFTSPLLFERIIRWFQFMFAPTSSELDHVIICWAGLLFAVVWFWIVFRTFSHPVHTLQKMKNDHLYAFSLICLSVISAASMGCVIVLKVPDGNYFMLMYAMTFIHLSFEFQNIPKHLTHSLQISWLPLVLCGIITCSISHWSWAPGFTPINLSRYGYYNHLKFTEAYYEEAQIDQICIFLEETPAVDRVVVFSSNIPAMLDIPAAAESSRDVNYWGSPELMKTANAFYTYCNTAKIDYLLVERPYVENDTDLSKILSDLYEQSAISVEMQQGTHYLLQFLSTQKQPIQHQDTLE